MSKYVFRTCQYRDFKNILLKLNLQCPDEKFILIIQKNLQNQYDIQNDLFKPEFIDFGKLNFSLMKRFISIIEPNSEIYLIWNNYYGEGYKSIILGILFFLKPEKLICIDIDSNYHFFNYIEWIKFYAIKSNINNILIPLLLILAEFFLFIGFIGVFIMRKTGII